MDLCVLSGYSVLLREKQTPFFKWYERIALRIGKRALFNPGSESLSSEQTAMRGALVRCRHGHRVAIVEVT